MNGTAVALFVCMALLCGYLLDYEKRQPEIQVYNCQGEIAIEVTLVDGKKLYPSRAYAKQDHVQLIMTDGRAITMAWAQVETIVSK